MQASPRRAVALRRMAGRRRVIGLEDTSKPADQAKNTENRGAEGEN
jgi:hypothetical protein